MVVCSELDTRVKEHMPTFGQTLRQWRKEAGLSLRALAEKADMSTTYLDSLERDKPHPVTGAPPQPRRKMVIALAHALHISEGLALEAAGYTPDAPAAVLIPYDGTPMHAIGRDKEIMHLTPSQQRDLLQAARLIQSLFGNTNGDEKEEEEAGTENANEE